MKVWINQRYGGVLFVAANSSEEAHEICLNSDRLESLYWGYGTENSDYLCRKIEAYHGYKWKGWKEVPDLEYTADIPYIIAEGVYTE